MNLLDSISGIHECFDRWRDLGSRELPGGGELIARFESEPGEETFLHVLHGGMSDPELVRMERQLGIALPRWLRCFYRRYGGMHLWGGAFVVHGLPSDGLRWPPKGPSPADIVQLNRLVGLQPWFPSDHLAFAQNGLDLSVHVASLAGDEILRCEYRTGLVMEVHRDLFECIDSRLHRMDIALVGGSTVAP